MAAIESRSAAAPPRRILLVEDDADALEVLSELLEAGGDEVSVSCTGTAVLALARLVRPDVVVMDLRLPDADGVDLIRMLKAADAATTIVAFSGALASEPAARAAGADWFVRKPYSDTLKQVLACLKEQRP